MDSFTVLGFLGEGAFGIVSKCRDNTSGKLFAIKMFTELDREEMSKAIAKEYTLLSTLQHDNVIRVVSHFIEEELLHCVFELMHHSIYNELQRQPQGLGRLLLRKYAFQTLRGVEYLHSVNVIHRDIKPDNLLVSASGVVKVADLGHGRAVDGDGRQNLTLSNGTLWYLPPEVLTRNTYSKSRDVWAMGCTFLEMATSTVFLPGSTFMEQLHMIVSKVGPLTVQQLRGFLIHLPTSRLPPFVRPANLLQKYRLRDRSLAQLVEASLQMDPDSRATCSELLGQKYFTYDSFHESFTQQLAEMVQADQQRALPRQPIALHQTAMETDEAGPSFPILLQGSAKLLLQSYRRDLRLVPDVAGTAAHGHLIGQQDPQHDGQLCDPPTDSNNND